MNDEELNAPELPSDHGYTAFDKLEYRQVIYPTDQKQSWRDMGNSYFYACRPLIAALAVGELKEDVEGDGGNFPLPTLLRIDVEAHCPSRKASAL